MRHYIKAAFAAVPSMDTFLTCATSELESQASASVATQMSMTMDFGGVSLYAWHRAKIYPRLAVRKARVEDFDDLVPVR